MKRILLILPCIILLSSCKATYTNVNDDTVDGYTIYQQESNEFFCRSYYEDIYYSGKDFNYGFRYQSCSPNMAFFILEDDEYVYLHHAIDQGLITLDSLMPLLEKIERDPEEFSSSEADYYWLDFHIGDEVVYAYAGGDCEEIHTEFFTINEIEYSYTASGCMQEHILFMRIDGDNIPVATLLADGDIDGNLLIPLLDIVN